MGATKELDDIKNSSDKMAPEDRVARTMDLQEDIAAKVEIIKKNAENEAALLPQGDKVPQDAQEYKDELNRITKYVEDLQTKTRNECDKYSEDVKFWAEYRTGIKEFTPWLIKAESSSTEGLSKPSNLDEANALAEKVHGFEKACVNLRPSPPPLKACPSHPTSTKPMPLLRKCTVLRRPVSTILRSWRLLTLPPKR